MPSHVKFKASNRKYNIILIQISKLTAVSIRLHHRMVRIRLTLELKTEVERTLISGVDVLW